MNKRNMFLGTFSTLVVAGILAFATTNFAFAEVGAVTDFETATTTSVNGFDGWSVTDSSFDQAVVDSSAYTTAGSLITGKALRISNAYASGGFGNQIFSKSLTDAVGETTSTAGAYSVGTLQNHFEMQFNIASASTSEQVGLAVTVSPDRGDGSRMSYLKFRDVSGGTEVIFFDVEGTSTPANFVSTTVATLDRATPHNIKLTLDAVEGASNDIVKVYVDGSVVHTGTSWEDYYRYDPEAVAEQSQRIIKNVLFRVSASAPTTGEGYLFDNVALTSSTVTPTTAYVVAPSSNSFGQPVVAGGVTYYSGINTYSSVQAAVNAATMGSTVYLTAGTYTEQLTVSKNLTITGAGSASTIVKAPSTTLVAGTASQTSIVEINSGATVTISGMNVTGPGPSTCGSLNNGIFVVGTSTLNLSNSSVTDVRDSALSGCQNGRAIRVGLSANNETGTATIDNVTISGYQKSGIFVDGTGSSATITNNTVTGVGSTPLIAQNGITLFGGATGTITGNTLSGNVYTGANSSVGILLYNQGTGVEVKNNTSTGNQIGLSIVGTTSAVVKNNKLGGNTELGLDTEVATNASPNFWGSAANPTTTGALSTSTLAAYSPWYTNASMTDLSSETSTTTETTSTTFTTETQTTATSTAGSIVLDIPAGTTISGDSNWDGTFNLPTSTTTATLPYELGGFVLNGVVAIEMGDATTSLTFDQPMKLTFAGQAGKLVGSNHNGVFTEILGTCTNSTNPTLADGADCKIDVGADLVVFTKHATTFLAYTKVAIAYGGGGSSSGGSSGSGSGSTGIVLGASTTTVATTPAVTTPGIIVTVGSNTNGQVLGASTYAFVRNLGYGATGDDVTELQKVLINAGYLKITVPTKWFGPMTKTALAKWQKANGIPNTGFFGVISRGHLAK